MKSHSHFRRASVPTQNLVLSYQTNEITKNLKDAKYFLGKEGKGLYLDVFVGYYYLHEKYEAVSPSNRPI